MVLIRPRIYRGTKRIILKWLVSLATVVTTVQSLPQLIILWSGSNDGVSLTAWILMFITTGIWIIYAHEFGRKKLLVDASLEAITQALVVLSLLVSRR